MSATIVHQPVRHEEHFRSNPKHFLSGPTHFASDPTSTGSHLFGPIPERSADFCPRATQMRGSARAFSFMTSAARQLKWSARRLFPPGSAR